MAAKKKSNPVVIGILLLLLVGLAGFGATNFGGSVGAVATVGETEIDASDYVRELEAEKRRFEQASGQPMTFAQMRALGLDQAVLGALVRDAALTEEADDAGLSVGDEAVGERIRTQPGFQGLSGQFDRETYEFALSRAGIRPGAYEEQVRADMAAALLDLAVGSGVRPPDIFVDTLFAYAREGRDVTWLRLTEADLDEPVAEPGEAELRAFFEKEATRFTRPETKVIDYAILTPDMVSDDLEADEDQLRALYEARIDEYVQPERRLVERLVFASDDAAAEARAAFDAGEASFEDLIADRGLTLADVDLGDVSRDELGPAADAVFALDAPGIVGPLPSPLGPALYRMNGVFAAQEIPFEDAREALRDEAVADRARRVIADEVPRVEDLLAGGADPAALAERTAMEVRRLEWRAGMDEGDAAYDAFREAAAGLVEGAFPELVELEDGGIAVLTLAEIRPPALPPFEEVEDDVREAWIETETGRRLTDRAEALAETLRRGEDALAGLDVETGSALERTAFVEGTPPDFTETLFEMEEGEVRVLSAGGDAWVVRLDRIVAADPSTPEAETARAAFSRQTADSLGQGLRAAFTQAVLEEKGYRVNSQTLSAVHSQLP